MTALAVEVDDCERRRVAQRLRSVGGVYEVVAATVEQPVPMDRSWYAPRDVVYRFEGRFVVHPFAFAQMAAGSDVFEWLRLVERFSVERAHARLDALARRLGKREQSVDPDSPRHAHPAPITDILDNQCTLSH